MERLTKRNPSWIDDETWERAEEPDTEEIDMVYLRLREYENILFDENGEERISLERLKELIHADAESRLVVLPCKVGDTVYEVQELRKRIQPYTIISIHISRWGVLFGWELKDGEGIYTNVNGFCDYAIGKTVFLTREEAEAALEKMGGGEK